MLYFPLVFLANYNILLLIVNYQTRMKCHPFQIQHLSHITSIYRVTTVWLKASKSVVPHTLTYPCKLKAKGSDADIARLPYR